VKKEHDYYDPSKVKAGGQPSQAQKHGYNKIVHSKPMDTTAIEPRPRTAFVDTVKNDNIKGGTVVQHNTRDMHTPLIDQLNNMQLEATSFNQDLRKKLRVDRVRKLTQGSGFQSTPIEDPSQPDWMKFKNLREIATIREAKKTELVTQMLHERSNGNYRTLYAMPGHNAFVTIPILNNGYQNEVFSVKIHDPDEHLLQGPEMQLVSDQAELSHWVMQGKCSRPPKWGLITTNNDVILEPNMQTDLLFKFMTTRDSNPSVSQSSKSVIKKRSITLVIVMSNG